MKFKNKKTGEVVEFSPYLINSALLSAQNRQRYYWCNWSVPQPEDRGILLVDILESDGVGVIHNRGEYQLRNEKSQCIDANYHKGRDNHGQRTLINCAAMVGRKLDENGNRNDSLSTKPIQCLEVHDHGKSRCLSTVSKDTLVSSLPPGRYPMSGIIYDQKNGFGEKLDKSFSLNASDWRGLNRNQRQTAVTNGTHYRKLTVVECCRLQGVPDDYFKVSSNTQAYKMLGNGWQVDTIEHIFSHCPLLSGGES